MSNLNWATRACAVFLLWAPAAVVLPAQTFTTLHSFDNSDGAIPAAGIVQATDGNFYGTTTRGGANGGTFSGGTVFRLSSSSGLMTLYNFCPQGSCGESNGEKAGLIQATDGNFYGTTIEGTGTPGMVFRITPSGTLTTLYSFCSQSACSDGSFPAAGLVQASDGNLYGTTSSGGINGWGTVFKITTQGILTTLHSFNGADGANPTGSLIQGTDGNLYGTTTGGGSKNRGTVFKITLGGALTHLYSFCPGSFCSDGSFPQAGLVQATNGDFYGTTQLGGAANRGTAFKITPGGTITTLYSFCSLTDCTDGSWPMAALVQATDRNFYGTTLYGGNRNTNAGTIFKMTPSGALRTLHTFCPAGGCTDGADPSAPLMQATDGSFYGTTGLGGMNNYGTIFNMSVGLSPFVETDPTSGKIGAPVKILGTNLSGATSVTFNGTPATFTVVSTSLITTTVPSGATSGTVQVVTPSDGTLSSNLPFRVRP